MLNSKDPPPVGKTFGKAKESVAMSQEAISPR